MKTHPTEKPDLTYSTYLKVTELLGLQELQSPDREHDEMLFIVIHQVFELWFKQILHELDHVIHEFQSNEVSLILPTLYRVRTILKVLVTQVDVLETMTPIEFNSFREFLQTASGFQSGQFRELEFLLGYKHPNLLTHFPTNTADRAKLERRFRAPTLWDAFLHFLSRQGYDLPAEVLERDLTEPTKPNEGVQKVLIEVYRNNPALIPLCESLLDLDEGLQEWRYRHVKMVERTIGMKSGSGGSAGSAYLRATLKPIFPDLWEIRVHL